MSLITNDADLTALFDGWAKSQQRLREEQDFADANHRHALEQAEQAGRAAEAQIARHGAVAFLEPRPAAPEDSAPGVVVPTPDPTALFTAPWSGRVLARLPRVDMTEARAQLARAIATRTEAANTLGTAQHALDRADAAIAGVEAELAAQTAREEARADNYAGRLRAHIEAGGAYEDRPSAGLPPPGARTAAELEGARAARLGIAGDYQTALATHRRAAEAVQQAVRGVLKAESAAIAARVEAAENALSALRSELRAALRLPEGTPILAGDDPVLALVEDATYEPAAEARWADYASRLHGDPDARV